MPGALDRYLIRSFLGRAGLIVAGLTALLLLFDVLANADDVVAGSGRVIVPVLIYAGLRLPEVVVLVVPLSALVATMAVLAHWVSTHQLVALRAAGVSFYRIVAALLGGAVLLALAHFWFADTVLPSTSSRLELWRAQDFQGLPPRHVPRRAPAWFAVGDALVEVKESSLDGRELSGVTVVHRDDSGALRSYMRAKRAFYTGQVWLLEDVRRAPLRGQNAPDVRTFRLNLPVAPKRFAALGERPGALRLGEIGRLIADNDLGGRPTHVYRAWYQRKLAQPVGVLVMVLLAAPLGLQHARRNRMMLASFGVMFTGFLFFVAERLLVALGETGMLPVALAVWTPAALFSILAAWVLLHGEG